MAGTEEPDDGTRRREKPANQTQRRSRPSEADVSTPPPRDPLTAVDLTRTRAEPIERAALDPGALIRGRYQLERLIGSGGMGQVWKAKDLVSERARDPNPFAAIKMLNANFESDPEAFVSLQRETKKSQELAHPNVITVFDFDIDDQSGRAFMSMELLEGEPLDRVICDRPSGMPRIEAIPLITGMARGLEYAHKKGIVHSDFKPGNVFITDKGEPKVLDFGIARAAQIVGIDRREDGFDAGSLGGLTPAYASVDMIERRPPHPADDVYALGLVAFEILTGKHPFARKDAKQAAAERSRPARIRSLRRYEWQAIARALEFDRDKRWQNAGEFLRAFVGKSIAAQAASMVALGLAIVAGVFGYQAYTASLPSVPFESLPAEVRAEFRGHISNAEGAWKLVEQGNGDESLDAASEYGKAYALHPRNSTAVAGLKKSADYILRRLETVRDPAERVQELKSVQALSEFYAHYDPLNSAIGAAGGK